MTDDFRARARELRHAARAQLAEIRAARLARGARPAPAASAVESVGAVPGAREASGLLASSSASLFAASALDAAEAEAPAPPEPLAEDVAPPLEMSAPTLPDTPPEALAAGLDLLPGIGPGLVWMLRRCGFETLDDLAAADAATLRERVGFVANLVNVEAWIGFARAQCAGKAA